MYIEFEELEISNFLSYGKTPTVIPLNTHPTSLLNGESGAGKSAIPNGLSFCLFDDTFRSIKKSQLINSENGKACLVQTKFRIGSDKYIIRRGIKPNILEVIKNGHQLNKDAKVSDLQSHIENNILRFDKRVFHQIVSLAEVNFIPFMVLEAKDRRSFVEKVLGAEIFSVMNSILKIQVKELEGKMEQLQHQSRSTQDKIEIHKKYVEKVKEENKEKAKELESEITDQKTLKIEALKEIEEIKENELKPLQGKNKEVAALEEKLEDTTSKIAKLETTLSQAKKRISFLEDNDVCPTCEREFSKEAKDKELKELKAKQSTCETNLEKGRQLRDSTKTEIQEINQRNREITKIIEKINGEEFKVKQCDNQIASLTKQLEKLKGSKAENLQEMLQEIKDLEKEDGKVQEEIEELTHTREVQNVSLQFLRDDGIKAEIIRKYIPKINLYVNKFLESMGFDILFHLNHEFDEEVRSRGREGFSYNSFSAGQRQRIDLALLFTWRAIAKLRNSVSTNLLFLDEVLDSHLNVEATEAVVDMFQSDLFKGTNVFVISHKKDIAGKFSRIMNFEMKNGFTRVS